MSKIEYDGPYCIITVNDKIFDSVPETMKISGSEGDVIFMCDNLCERQWLISRGIDLEMKMDYFKLVREDEQR